MTANFHKISDDRKKINKIIGDPIGGGAIMIKTPSSIMRPVIQITKSALGTEWYQANYVHIPEFGRYYFIDDITADNDGLLTIQCSVDVLYTYAQDINITRFQVVRAQRSYNKAFIDTQIPLQANKAIRQDKNLDFLGSIPQDTGTAKYNYVMTVTGGLAAT